MLITPASPAERLGLNPTAVFRTAQLGKLRAEQAMSHTASQEVPMKDEKGEPSPSPERAPADQVDYVCDHGFRALGLMLVSSPWQARVLGEQLCHWLMTEGSLAWPLAYATARLEPENRQALARDLHNEPATAARDLAACLLPPDLAQQSRPDVLPARRWSRTALAPYGIDLELLRCVVYGRAIGTETAMVSDISTPVVVRTLYQSIEVALREARADTYHVSRGIGIIQPTDPELVIAIRACLLSEHAGPSVRSLPDDLPMCQALVQLVVEAEL